MVETSPSHQRQQDAGEFLDHLLDQFCLDKGEDGEALLARHLTKPRLLTAGITDALVSQLTAAAARKDAATEHTLLCDYADAQWDATANTARRTKIGKFFQGQSIKVKKCVSCGLYSPCSADPCLVEELKCAHLEGASVEPSLEALLRAESAAETPEGYRCDGCGRVGTTRLLSGLLRLPRVYVVRLNRALTNRRGEEERVDTSIDFPDTLDLAASGRLLFPQHPPKDYHGSPCGSQYRLFGAVFHRGTSIRSGHYFASIRNSAGQSLEAEGLPSQESTTIRSRWSRAPSPLPRAKSESGCPWQVGDRCEHREHGKGTVVFVDYASPTVRPHPRIHPPSAALSISCPDLCQPRGLRVAVLRASRGSCTSALTWTTRTASTTARSTARSTLRPTRTTAS